MNLSKKSSETPVQSTDSSRYSYWTLIAVELAGAYEDGFLPSYGGWNDQDWVYTMLIREALAAKRERERINEKVRLRGIRHKR